VSLELKGVTVRYPAGTGFLTAVDGIDIVVPKGGTLGLVGESGCGKSSVARAIVGLVPITRGRLFLDGKDYTSQRKRDSREFRRRVQLIFQDPYSSLNPRMTVGEMIREGLRLRGTAARTEAARILDLVGLSASALQSYPHQFSGGQRQRIAIARALAVGPELIINDEVTSALDVSVQATILNLLRDLQRELGLSYLFISHDLSIVRFMSDAIAVMYLGQVVEAGSTNHIFQATEHPYTKALIASVPDVGTAPRPPAVSGELPDPRQPPPGCRFHTRCPVGPLKFPDRRICMTSDPQLTANQRSNRAACHFASTGPGVQTVEPRRESGTIPIRS